MDKDEHHGQSTLGDDILLEAQKKFTAFDANGNGTIDRDELAGLIRAMDLMKYIPNASELEDDDPPLYIVNVHTGGHPEAGTDAGACDCHPASVFSVQHHLAHRFFFAGVYVTLFGEAGDTGKRELTSKISLDAFNRGQINTFKLRLVHKHT